MNIGMDATIALAKLKESVMKEIRDLIGSDFDITQMTLRYRPDGTCEELYYKNVYFGKFTVEQLTKKDGTKTVLVNFTPAYNKEQP